MINSKSGQAISQLKTLSMGPLLPQNRIQTHKLLCTQSSLSWSKVNSQGKKGEKEGEREGGRHQEREGGGGRGQLTKKHDSRPHLQPTPTRHPISQHKHVFGFSFQASAKMSPSPKSLPLPHNLDWGPFQVSPQPTSQHFSYYITAHLLICSPTE